MSDDQVNLTYREILRKKREIKRRLINGPDKYPDYCRRLGLDMLSLLSLLIEETFDKDTSEPQEAAI